MNLHICGVWNCIYKARFQVVDNLFEVFEYSETNFDCMISEGSNNHFKGSCNKIEFWLFWGSFIGELVSKFDE